MPPAAGGRNANEMTNPATRRARRSGPDGPIPVETDLQGASGVQDLLVARELEQVGQALRGLDLPPAHDPLPIEQEVPGRLASVLGEDLLIGLDHLEGVLLVQDLHRDEWVLRLGELAGGIDLERL